MLLDYVSPLQAISLAKAIRYRHWPVVFSIVGFVTLKVIVLFSTALLVAISTTLSGNFKVAFSNEFNGSTMWRDIVQDDIPTQFGSYSAAFSNISGDAVWAYQKVLEGELSQPQNTRADVVYQAFELTSKRTKPISLSTDVQVFTPKVTCEIGNVTTKGDIESNATSYTNDYSHLSVFMNLQSPTCPLKATNYSAEITATYCVGQSCPPWTFSYSIHRVGCSYIFPENRSTPWTNADAHDFRFVLVAANISSDSDRINPGAPQLHEATAVFCKFDYGLYQRKLTYDGEDNSFQLAGDLGRPRGYLNDLTQLQFAELVFAGLASGARDEQWGEDSVSNFSQSGSAADALFRLMLLVTALPMKEEYVKTFLNPKKMIEAVDVVVPGVAVQFIQQNFLQSARKKETTLASGSGLEDRLHVRMPSLWVMVVGFIVMTVITIGILVTSHHGVVPRNPTSLAFHATALSANPDLQAVLGYCGHKNSKQLRTTLQCCDFSTSLNQQSFRITPSYTWTSPSTPTDDETNQDTWLPVAAWLPVAGTMLITPLLAIAVLEALSSISVEHDGLVNLDESNYTITAIVYSTTLFLLLIATLYNNFEFTTSLFAPFNTLRSGIAEAKRSLHSHPLGETAPIAFFQMVRDRHLGAALSISAAIIGSTLAIVASGLWVVGSSPQFVREANGLIMSTWNVSWLNSSQNDNGAMELLNNIHRNLSQPSVHVWNNLALPNLEATLTNSTSSLEQRLLGSDLNYTFVVPSLRPELSCDVVPTDSLFITFTEGNPNITHQATWIFAALADAPSKCFQNYTGKPIGMRWSQGGPGRELTPLAGWRSMLLPIYELDPFDVVVKEPYLRDDFVFPRTKEHETSCPSFGVYFGYGGSGKTDIWDDGTVTENLTALVCYQRLREINTTVVYAGDLDSRSLSDQQPLSVSVDEKSSRYVRNETANSDTFSYEILPHRDALEPFLGNAFRVQYSSVSYGSDNYNIDEFFNHISHMNPELTPKDLFGAEHISDLIEAVATIYKEYMVNVIDLNFRTQLSATNASSATAIDGTATRLVSRLKINSASKLALQIMLGAMTILGGAAFCLVDLRKTLPRDPCSIASTMALFAGSKMCSREYMPEGTEWLSEQELNHFWRGQKFSLGWWPADEGRTEACRDNMAKPLSLACSKQDDKIQDLVRMRSRKICLHEDCCPTVHDPQQRGLLADGQQVISQTTSHVWQQVPTIASPDQGQEVENKVESVFTAQAQTIEEGHADSTEPTIHQAIAMPLIKRKPLPFSAAKRCSDLEVEISEIPENYEEKTSCPSTQRFGIDIGMPTSLGFVENGGWRRRLRRGTTFGRGD